MVYHTVIQYIQKIGWYQLVSPTVMISKTRLEKDSWFAIYMDLPRIQADEIIVIIDYIHLLYQPFPNR
jgi:hypothetical protein